MENQRSENIVSSKRNINRNFTCKNCAQILRNIMITLLILAVFSTPVNATGCNKNNCRFNGRCERIFYYGRRPSASDDNKECKCPDIKCYSGGLWEPVCGSDGKTHFNIMCMMIEECEKQKAIKPICYGRCGSQACRDTKNTPILHRSCSSEESGFCQNGGLCYTHTLLKEIRCKCPTGFAGSRCHIRDIPLGTAKAPHGEDCLPYKIGFALMTGLFLATVAYQLISCSVQKKNREIKAKCKLWPFKHDSKSKLPQGDIEERTPLRCTRSDGVFPNRARINGSSE